MKVLTTPGTSKTPRESSSYGLGIAHTCRNWGAGGKLVAVGPFIDGSGALFNYEVDSLDAATSIVAADSYMTGGTVASYELRPWEIIGADRDPSYP